MCKNGYGEMHHAWVWDHLHNMAEKVQSWLTFWRVSKCWHVILNYDLYICDIVTWNIVTIIKFIIKCFYNFLIIITYFFIFIYVNKIIIIIILSIYTMNLIHYSSVLSYSSFLFLRVFGFSILQCTHHPIQFTKRAYAWSMDFLFFIYFYHIFDNIYIYIYILLIFFLYLNHLII